MKIDKILFVILMAILIAGFVFFVFFSTRISFHDTHEYITAAKELAGVHNVRIHSGHSYVYPFFMSFFVSKLPSLTTMKFINFLWIILTGLLLYLHYKNKKMLILWFFSPLAWYMSIQVSPILPTGFFFTLGYILFKIWDNQKTKIHLIFSSLFFGVCLSLYEPSLILIGLFSLIFFFDKSFKDVLLFFVFLIPTAAIRLVLDYYLFNFPLYSWIRYLGNNALVIAGKSFNVPTEYRLYLIAILFLISPLLFYLYKINLKKNLREILFVSLLVVFFMVRGGVWKAVEYFVMFSSIMIIMLSKVLDEKKVIISIIISILIIIPLTFSYFGENADTKALKDLQELKNTSDYFITDEATPLASLLWTDKPFFIWLKEYQAKDAGYFSDYNIRINPKINTLESLQLDARLNTRITENINGPLLLSKQAIPPQEFTLERCLRTVCIYRKL